ncbi:MAG TPA: hypothetical protein PLW48_05530 [Alphaproteobacteria bacterium]|nr:hypothetical protein [Alphaproteobacteria bacterium]
MASDNKKQRGENSRPSLSASFAKAARKRFSTMLLGAALISGCATGVSGQAPAQAAPVVPQDTITAQVDTVEVGPRRTLPPAEVQRRAQIRAILLTDAQTRYPELADDAQTAYSGKLQTLQDSLNTYLNRADTAMHNTIVVLDPSKIDVALSIGLSAQQAIAQEVAKHGRALPESTIDAAAGNAVRDFTSEAGAPGYTQNPSAYPNMSEQAARPCLIIPSSDHGLLFDVPGLTKAQKIEFTNTHEGWHCLDSRYRMTEAQLEALQKNSPRSLKSLIENADLRGGASVIHHKEALADIAALGDMIRRGHDPAIIGHTIGWRQNEVGHDYLHYSVPGLNLLKQRIDSMGIDAFREMAPAAARDLYFEVNDATALTPAKLLAMAEYLKADVTVRATQRAAAPAGSDTAAGIAYAEEILKPAVPQQVMRDIIAVLTPPDISLRKALMDWKPIDRLEQGAIADGGKITPETLIRSYGKIQNELHGQLFGEEAEARLAREKMALVKSLFVLYVQGVDYVTANEKYGVDIEAAEKDLLARGRAADIGQPKPKPENAPAPMSSAPAGKQRTAGTPNAGGENLNLQNTPAGHDGCGCPQTGYKIPRR